MNSKTFLMILSSVMSARSNLRNNKTEFLRLVNFVENSIKDNQDDLQTWYECTISLMIGKLAIKMEAMQEVGVDPMNSSLTPEIVKDIQGIEKMYKKKEEHWNESVSNEIETLTN
jgi:hypothetical protein